MNALYDLSVHTYQHTGIHTKVSVQLRSPPHHNDIIISNKDIDSMEDTFPLHEGNQCGRYKRLCTHQFVCTLCMYLCTYVRMHL